MGQLIRTWGHWGVTKPRPRDFGHALHEGERIGPYIFELIAGRKYDGELFWLAGKQSLPPWDMEPSYFCFDSYGFQAIGKGTIDDGCGTMFRLVRRSRETRRLWDGGR